MAQYQLLNTTDFVTTLEKESIINFLMANLEEYQDSRDNVSRAVEYALSKFPHQGGFVLIARKDEDIIGICVVNRTNFEGYFAENIIAFLAICSEERRTGVATDLLKQVMVYSKGSIAARLKPDEKIADLFRKSGFGQDAHEFILKR
ncbi:GNAT family N-acetyltransferase [Flavobacteriales bacterium]|nr:GNAT family N-acetyltransferase [Flavobacteriales bacterium]